MLLWHWIHRRTFLLFIDRLSGYIVGRPRKYVPPRKYHHSLTSKGCGGCKGPWIPIYAHTPPPITTTTYKYPTTTTSVPTTTPTTTTTVPTTTTIPTTLPTTTPTIIYRPPPTKRIRHYVKTERCVGEGENEVCTQVDQKDVHPDHHDKVNSLHLPENSEEKFPPIYRQS